MTRLRFFISVLAANFVVFAAAGSLLAGEAHACSCANIGGPEKELRLSDAIFTGEVSSAEADELAPGSRPPSLGKVVFEREDSWKGGFEDSVTVYGQGGGAMCGLNFEEGKSYLVYAIRGTKEPDSPL